MSTFLSLEILGLLNGYQLLIIIHLFGLAVGAGAAFFSDFLFNSVMKDRFISSEELRILTLTMGVVWLGLSILIVSGLLIFLGDMERLLNSPKFLAKMTVVGILALNGVLFHFKHLPILKQFTDKNLRDNFAFHAKSRGLFVSGGVSGVSWATAVILGAMPFIDYSYFIIMAVYAIALLVGALAGLALHKIIT
jgi:hypothetical protein